MICLTRIWRNSVCEGSTAIRKVSERVQRVRGGVCEAIAGELIYLAVATNAHEYVNPLCDSGGDAS